MRRTSSVTLVAWSEMVSQSMYSPARDPGPEPTSVKPSGPSAAVSRLLASSPRITSSVKNSIPQLLWCTTNHSLVPSSL